MDGLTGGPFLAGIALATGAGTPEIAMLAALPFIAQVLQLPTVAVLLRITDRRRMVVFTAGASRAVYIVIAAMFAWGALGAGGLLWLVALSTALAVVATAAWNWWMRDLLPQDELGAFFGSRLRGATIVSIVAMLGAGLGLDAFLASNHAREGYGLLFAFGGIVGLLGVWSLAVTPHVAPPPSAPARKTLPKIWHAYRHAGLPLLSGLSLIAIAASFALPFAAIFMLRSLHFSFTTITVMAVISQLAYLAGLRGWVYTSDKYGDRPVLVVALGVLALALLGWGLAGWTSGWAILALVGTLHFLSGFALSGIELGTNNLFLRSAPADNAAAHLAAVSVFRAGAGGLGILLAGLIWTTIGAGPVWPASADPPGWALRGFQVLAWLSILPCLAAIAVISRTRTPQQPRIYEVARTIRREVSQMSSIAGIRAFIHAVSYSVEFLATPFAARPGLPRHPKKP